MTARPPEPMNAMIWLKLNKRRLLNRSANRPIHGPKIVSGKYCRATTKPTANPLLFDRSRTSQLSATVRIQVPLIETVCPTA